MFVCKTNSVVFMHYVVVNSLYISYLYYSLVLQNFLSKIILVLVTILEISQLKLSKEFEYIFPKEDKQLFTEHTRRESHLLSLGSMRGNCNELSLNTSSVAKL